MSDQTMIELARRAFATEEFHWLRGMPATATVDGEMFSLICLGSETPYYTADFYCFDYMEQWEDIHIDDQIEMELLPDLEGGAALGCLLALVREVYDDPKMHTWPYANGWAVAASDGWETDVVCPTEIHALVDALEIGGRR